MKFTLLLMSTDPLPTTNDHDRIPLILRFDFSHTRLRHGLSASEFIFRVKRPVAESDDPVRRFESRAQQLQTPGFVNIGSSPPKVDLVHIAEPDEWCVTVNGERVLSFSGPSAWTKALSHRAELHDLLGRGTPENRDDVVR
jgi:hypothetical protein